MAEPPNPYPRAWSIRQTLLFSVSICVFTTALYLLFNSPLTWPSIAFTPTSSTPTSKAQPHTNQTPDSAPEAATELRGDVAWYPPLRTAINDLESVVNGSGVFGYVFRDTMGGVTSDRASGAVRREREVNWCDMPRVRAEEYVVPQGFEDGEWELRYVEVIHRHHKRTPYQSNIFPLEPYPFPCTSTLELSAISDSIISTHIAWNITPSPLHSFNSHVRTFPNTSCLYPQITAGGLHDSHRHGLDLASVYGHTGLLRFLPATYDPHTTTFRVTNNQITSQVASALIPAIFPDQDPSAPVSVTVQPATIDSLEPAYPCPRAAELYSSYGIGSHAPNWTAHLHFSRALFEHLDAVSSIDSTDPAWHVSFDHYFDNLSAKLCHSVALPCRSPPSSSRSDSKSECISPSQASGVFRAGMHEYNYLYRAAPLSLAAATASYGAFLAELAANLRRAAAGDTEVRYRHNVAHDGSVSRLLSVLQVEEMGWPGMGAEVVFELWRRRRRRSVSVSQSRSGSSASACASVSVSVDGDREGEGEWHVRVLWMGRVLRSSHPQLGVMDMVPLEKVVGYFDSLVGRDGARMMELCGLG